MSKSLASIAILFVVVFMWGCKTDTSKTAKPEAKKPETAVEAKKAEGVTFTHEAAKVSITLPSQWTTENVEEGMLAYSPNKEIAMHFMVLHSDQLDAALTEVDKVLEKDVKNLKLQPAENVDFNGMKAIIVDGKGDGMDVGFAIIDTPVPNKSLFIGAWANPETVKKHEKDLQFILQNIKPVK